MMDLVNECVDCACESEALENAWKILTASKKRNFVAVQVSPAVRVSIGETFGLARGEDAVGKLVAALELLGADVVVDTAVATDALTLLRLKTLRENKEAGKGLPVYSSECSAWAAHAKEKYPEIELLPTATTVSAKLLKKHYGEQMPDKKIRVISLEMGEAKKCEPGVDVVLTLDELARLIEGMEANVRLLKKQPLTAALGIASGAAYIAAASGGDAEALARCLTSEKTQLNFRKLAYSGLYGSQARREAAIVLDGEEWKFAVVDSLEEADALIADVQAGVADYDYVEVTACAGGQIGKGCDLADEEGEMTRRLRKLGLQYLDFSRAARSSDMNATAAPLLKKWNALCRSGEVDAYDAIDEIVEDFDKIEEVVEVVEAAPVEEVAEEIEAVEEITEEPAIEEVEEVVDEAPAEEIAEEPVIEAVEEVAIEEVAEEVVEDVFEEEVVEEVLLEVFEEETEEETTETVEEEMEAPQEEAEAVEEIEETQEVIEVVEEVAAAEVLEEPVVEDVEELTQETVEEVVEEEVSAIEEIAEAVEEAPAIEEVAEVIETVEEEPVETAVEEVAEEIAQEEPVVEEVAEEPVVEEVAAEEVVVEEIAEEIVEEIPVVEEAEEVSVVEETPAEEPVVEEATEEVEDEDEEEEAVDAVKAHGGRLSTKDRRKLKRAKKKNKKK